MQHLVHSTNYLLDSPVTYPALRCPVAEFSASRAAEWQILAKRGDLDPM
jgi:hypothetical protein